MYSTTNTGWSTPPVCVAKGPGLQSTPKWMYTPIQVSQGVHHKWMYAPSPNLGPRVYPLYVFFATCTLKQFVPSLSNVERSKIICAYSIRLYNIFV